MKLQTVVTKSALILLLLIMPTVAEVVKVGDYRVEIDFGGTAVNITQSTPFMIGGLTASSLRFVTEDAKGTVTICESLTGDSHSILVSNCDRVLDLIMALEYIN